MRENGLYLKGEAETLDIIRRWDLKILQGSRGYRFSIDSLILAHLAQPNSRGMILDMGTGCGILALILARRFPEAQVKGIEIQKEMVRRAIRNTEINGLNGQVEILQGSYAQLKDLFSEGSFHYVISNPPYRRVGSGRINPFQERAVARHELFGDLTSLLKNAHYALKPKGKIGLIFTSKRITDLIYIARKEGLEPKRIRFLHSYIHEEAQGIFMEAAKGSRKGETMVEPPFVIYHSPGIYTEEAREVLGE